MNASLIASFSAIALAAAGCNSKKSKSTSDSESKNVLSAKGSNFSPSIECKTDKEKISLYPEREGIIKIDQLNVNKLGPYLKGIGSVFTTNGLFRSPEVILNGSFMAKDLFSDRAETGTDLPAVWQMNYVTEESRVEYEIPGATSGKFKSFYDIKDESLTITYANGQVTNWKAPAIKCRQITARSGWRDGNSVP